MSGKRKRRRRRPPAKSAARRAAMLSERKITLLMRGKLVGLFFAVLLAFGVLVLRLTYINAKNGEAYKKQVMSQHQQQYGSRTLPFRRGDITDRNGSLLAVSNKVYNLVLDCSVTNEEIEQKVPDTDEKNPETIKVKAYIEPTKAALQEYFGVKPEKVQEALEDDKTKDSRYHILKREVSIEEKKKFEEYLTITEEEEKTLSLEEITQIRRVRGVYFEETYIRKYPFDSLACDTIGFALADNTAGLENYYNSTLNGVDGRQYGYLNQEADVRQNIIEPVNGSSIVTTLDVGVQQIVEKYVDAFKEKMGAENIGVIVEDPKTGEILAMDGGDRYDLNDPTDLSTLYSESELENMGDGEKSEVLNNLWRNYCVTDVFEPGSVMKPLVVAAALEKGVINESDNFVCDGFQIFGNGETRINCANVDGHGPETLEEVLAYSCNDGMMQIGAKIGAEQFLRTQSLFNFGARTGIDLPNEGSGLIHDESEMDEVVLACSAFGQGFNCTMIQEINAICSILNGGYYYQPHLVSRVLDANKSVVKTIHPVLQKQTVSETISADLRSYMKASVDYGTSQKSKVQGYSSGGKTATAEKFPRGNQKYLVGFVNFAPANDPQVVIYVVLDEIHAEEQDDSSYPQYIAQGIMSELLPYLNIRPDEAGDGELPSTELWEGFRQIVPEDAAAANDDSGMPESISNPSIPEPPASDGEEEPLDENRAGMTNEEAGLEE